MKIPSPRLNSHVEIGFCLYLYAQTEEIRKNLKEFFFEDHFRVMLYAVCLLGVLYSPKPEELEERYWKSLISHIYPSLPLDEDGLPLYYRPAARKRTFKTPESA